MHRAFIDTLLNPSLTSVDVGGDEAAHTLLVKRLSVGDRLEVLDGHGGVAGATITFAGKAKRDPLMTLELRDIRAVPRIEPIIEVCSAVPKGDRASQLIDQLAQVGASSWRALQTDHGVAEAGSHKLDRFTRIAREASKQCGRAWLMRIDEPIGLEAALAGDVARVLVADATGANPSNAGVRTVVGGVTRLLVGPEGGWSPRERAAFARAGVLSVRAGPHVMRIETAAVAAVAGLMLA